MKTFNVESEIVVMVPVRVTAKMKVKANTSDEIRTILNYWEQGYNGEAPRGRVMEVNFPASTSISHEGINDALRDREDVKILDHKVIEDK